MTERRSQRTFSDQFKHQMVELYNSEKSWAEIIKEYVTWFNNQRIHG